MSTEPFDRLVADLMAYVGTIDTPELVGELADVLATLPTFPPQSNEYTVRGVVAGIIAAVLSERLGHEHCPELKHYVGQRYGRFLTELASGAL